MVILRSLIHDIIGLLQKLDESLIDLLNGCLSVSQKTRYTPDQVLNHDVLKPFNSSDIQDQLSETLLLRCSLKQIYYWWQLAGGDVHVELNKEGLIRSEAPILMIPT